MPDVLTRITNAAPPSAARPFEGVNSETFLEAFGEPLTGLLNIDSWRLGADLSREYQRVEDEIAAAVSHEATHVDRIRHEVFPRISMSDGAPREAGVYDVRVDEIKHYHRAYLFSGQVEACDGTSHLHDTLALTIHQIGVCLVNYCGNQGSWSQRLYRRDLRQSHGDPVELLFEMLERRRDRAALDHQGGRDGLSELAQRALMSYAEAAALLHKAVAPWRVGHGSPAPYQLLNGGGCADVAVESVKVLRDLLGEHRRVAYVSSEPEARDWLTIGQALRPLEYAVIGTLAERIERFTQKLSYSSRPSVDCEWGGKQLSAEQWVLRFRDTVATDILGGVYRVSHLAPPQLFYAHRDHVHEAARVVMADSVLLEARGFPMLIDLADRACHAVYGGNSLGDLAAAAYARADAPRRYGSERQYRPK